MPVQQIDKNFNDGSSDKQDYEKVSKNFYYFQK
jgi:hypothetical protein